MMKRLFVATGALLLALSSFAQQPAAGTYITEGGWGTLVIKRDGAFVLESVGSNAHACSLEGSIVGGRAVMQEGCTVRFERKGQTIRVAPAREQNTCRDYCGMRAGFEGTYHPEPQACRQQALESERAAFLAQYRERRFQAAATRLEKLLGRCSRWLWWTADAEIRNDLALAQHRAGRSADCLATFKPIEHLLAPDAYLPPAEQEWANGVVPQMRINRDQCVRGAEGRPR